MKTKNFSKSGMLGLSAFLFASSVIIALCNILSFDESCRKMYFDMALTDNSFYSEASKGINTDNSNWVINKKITKLEKEKAEITGKLEKAKADRNKDHGMVAGMYYQPSQDLAEIINLEKKIGKLDNKIAALQKIEKNEIEKNGNIIQRLALK